MIILNELLEEKYDTQRRLNNLAENSLKKYFDLINGIVEKSQKESKTKLKYKKHEHC